MRRLVGIAVFSVALCGCKGKLDALSEALVAGDVTAATEVVSSPSCVEEPVEKCLSALSAAFGAKRAFDWKNPDQASAGAVAVVLLRDRRGDWIPHAETWFLAVKESKGVGADALRLAIATRMAEVAPRVGKGPEDERAALDLAHAIGTSIPGACATYGAIGADVDLDKMAPEKTPDHAPCIQRDLVRQDGMGPAYGYGGWRAFAAAVALWKDEARALRAGLDRTASAPRKALEAKLSSIDEASVKVVLRTMEAGAGALGGVHEATGAVPAASTPPR